MPLVVEFGLQGEAGGLGHEQRAILAVGRGQEEESIGVAGPGGGGHAVGEHLDRVAPLILQLPAHAGRQQRAVLGPAGLDAFDQAVEPLAEFGLLVPIERVAGAHEELGGVGRIHTLPADPVARRIGLARQLAKPQQHVVRIGVGQQVLDVGNHGGLEGACSQCDPPRRINAVGRHRLICWA